ncbi:EF-hand domain-containing protein [Pseudomonas aeruginosa]|nr:EF-hand domain-containing protein [Pseudomonas aeruginosa]
MIAGMRPGRSIRLQGFDPFGAFYLCAQFPCATRRIFLFPRSGSRPRQLGCPDRIHYRESFHMRLLTRMLCAGLLLGSMASQATAAGIDDIFRSQDTDKDGALSLEEARAAAPEAFRRLDRDGNGIVDADEIAANMVAEAGPGMVIPPVTLAAVSKSTVELWDGNRDGKVTGQEYSDSAVTLLMLADADGDRRVTREELQRFRGEPAAR